MKLPGRKFDRCFREEETSGRLSRKERREDYLGRRVDQYFGRNITMKFRRNRREDYVGRKLDRYLEGDITMKLRKERRKITGRKIVMKLHCNAGRNVGRKIGRRIERRLDQSVGGKLQIFVMNAFRIFLPMD